MSVIKVTLKVVTKKKASTVMAIGDNSVQERKIEAPLLDPFKKQTGSFDSFITGKQKKMYPREMTKIILPRISVNFMP